MKFILNPINLIVVDTEHKSGDGFYLLMDDHDYLFCKEDTGEVRHAWLNSIKRNLKERGYW